MGGCEERVTVLIMRASRVLSILAPSIAAPPVRVGSASRCRPACDAHRCEISGGLTEVFQLWRVPELSRPSGKRIGQGFSPIRLGHLGEQSLRVEVAVGTFPGSRALRARHRCSRANPRSDGARRSQEIARSALASGERDRRGWPNASPPQEDTKPKPFPGWEAGR